MSPYIFLPIAGNSVNIFLLLGMGGFVGFLSALVGVGGGFLLTPLLIMIGIPPTIAAASDSNQIVASSSSATYAHWRLGNVDYKMGLFLLIGGITGSNIGVQIIKALRVAGNADVFIKIVYVLMLGFIGTFMLTESIRKLRRRPLEIDRKTQKEATESWFTKLNRSLPFFMTFDKAGVCMSPLMPLLLGTLVGTLAAIMGVGGGFIMIPVMVYLLRMPMHVAIGTDLFQIIFTCIAVTFLQAVVNHTVDFTLALVLLLGSTLGAQVGARVSKRLRGDHLKIILAVIVLLVMIKLLLELLIQPECLLAPRGGH